MDAKKIIEEIISLDKKIAELRDRFDELPEDSKGGSLESFFQSETGGIGPMDSVTIGLVRATDMVCGLESGGAGILAGGLNHPNVEVRQLSGEALLSLAEDGIEQIVPAVDAALTAGAPASEEMPFILAMIDSPGVAEHITRFLDLDETDAVVAGIEALAEVGDPTTLTALESLSGDTRKISVDAGDGQIEELTIGRLASEAIELISSEED